MESKQVCIRKCLGRRCQLGLSKLQWEPEVGSVLISISSSMLANVSLKEFSIAWQHLQLLRDVSFTRYCGPAQKVLTQSSRFQTPIYQTLMTLWAVYDRICKLLTLPDDMCRASVPTCQSRPLLRLSGEANLGWISPKLLKPEPGFR